MDREYFDELKNKITDYVENNTKESLIIGGVAAVVIGYLGYKLFYSGTSDEGEESNK